ncbi:hypothetical protein [Candidatus Rariloculus sp.]|uniref:hypothetical protein n=1 Tax=Candidatus Rariloculus sp. TaxID=3101265 RepID=UPI003D0EA85A
MSRRYCFNIYDQRLLAQQPVARALRHSTGDAPRLSCVARRSNMSNILAPRALSGGRLAGLGATRGFATGCHVRYGRSPIEWPKDNPGRLLMPIEELATRAMKKKLLQFIIIYY